MDIGTNPVVLVTGYVWTQAGGRDHMCKCWSLCEANRLYTVYNFWAWLKWYSIWNGTGQHTRWLSNTDHTTGFLNLLGVGRNHSTIPPSYLCVCLFVCSLVPKVGFRSGRVEDPFGLSRSANDRARKSGPFLFGVWICRKEKHTRPSLLASAAMRPPSTGNGLVLVGSIRYIDCVGQDMVGHTPLQRD